jgi:hypothetical protein
VQIDAREGDVRPGHADLRVGVDSDKRRQREDVFGDRQLVLQGGDLGFQRIELLLQALVRNAGGQGFGGGLRVGAGGGGQRRQGKRGKSDAGADGIHFFHGFFGLVGYTASPHVGPSKGVPAYFVAEACELLQARRKKGRA